MWRELSFIVNVYEQIRDIGWYSLMSIQEYWEYWIEKLFALKARISQWLVANIVSQ